MKIFQTAGFFVNSIMLELDFRFFSKISKILQKLQFSSEMELSKIVFPGSGTILG